MTALSVPCWLTAPFGCNYLPEKIATTLVVDQSNCATEQIYPILIDQGFRRSGAQLYRPNCANCQACISIRIAVQRFQPTRHQRRVFKKHANWQVINKNALFYADHFALYQRYLQQRHQEQADVNETDYQNFLCSPNSMTNLHEFWRDNSLIAVAVTDYLPQGLSAVYTFFDPEFAHLSPGCFAILWQIHHALQLKLPYVYLGYWVAGCRKMAYKSEYQPAEIFFQGQWQDFNPLFLKGIP
jgi:arginine-tRNA-protein transferase